MTAFTTEKSKNLVSNKQGPEILNSTGSVSLKQGRNLKRGPSKKK